MLSFVVSPISGEIKKPIAMNVILIEEQAYELMKTSIRELTKLVFELSKRITGGKLAVTDPLDTWSRYSANPVGLIRTNIIFL